MMKSKNLTYLMTHPLILWWFMLLGAVMMFLLGRQTHSRYMQAHASGTVAAVAPQFAVGQYVTVAGDIRGAYGFGMLKLRSNDDQAWIIKSTTTNITQLTGAVSVQGTISEYNGLVPVINVNQYKSDSLPDAPQFWYDANNGVIFRPGYDVSIVSTGDLISITDPIVNKEVVRIRSFPCQGTGAYDECSIEADAGNRPGFISSYRYKFIQGDGVWYVFGDGIGYRIWTSDEYYINTMSQYFELMNTRVMAEMIRKNLKLKCVGPETNVVDYVSHTMREQNGNTFVIVRGLSSSKKLSICQLKLVTEQNSIGFESITTIPVEE